MPEVAHIPSSPWVMNPCAPCCKKLRCKDEEGNLVSPSSLGFIVSIVGSCGQAINAMESGVLGMSGDGWTQPRCDDAPGEGQTYCENVFPRTCSCYLAWFKPVEDIPVCGPYIGNVVMQCLPRGARNLPVNCPHLKDHKWLWYVIVTVNRAKLLVRPPPACHSGPIIEEGVPPDLFCKIQDCGTCDFVDTLVTEDPVDRCAGCTECPPCTNCPTHNATRCADNLECCGTEGCQFCTCPEGGIPCVGECAQCTHCIERLGNFAGYPDPSCMDCPTASYEDWRYHFWIEGCEDPDDILGCNMTACPRDDKNTGTFYLRGGCNENDFFEISCVS